MYDLVIIGAGPAGLMAARTLPNNISFILIDKKKEIGKPLCCGEGIRRNGFVKLFGSDNYGFIRNSVNEHEVIYKDIRRRFKASYLELDREKFEKFLADGIEDKINLNTKCDDIVINKNCVEVITNKGRIKAKIAILAYGCDFRIQRKYSMIAKCPRLLLCYGGICKNYGFDKNKFYAYFDERYAGYFWIFPKNENEANIGFATVVRKTNVKDIFNLIAKKITPKLRMVSEYSGVVPCSGPIDKTYSNRLLVCGDSAGFVYAGTGEGIYFALESGRIAAETAKEAIIRNRFDKDFLAKYEKKWKSSFGKLMEAGLIFYDLQGLAFRKGLVKELFTLPKDEEIEGMIIKGDVPLKAKLVWHLARLVK